VVTAATATTVDTEVQATVASKGVVVRARGTNPINKGTLLIL
jgi:hypothetical protein